MGKQTDDVNARFDDAKIRVWKLFLAIMQSVYPDFEEPEPK